MTKIMVPLEVSDLFSVREAATLIGVSPATLYRWVKAGKVATVTIAGQRLLDRGEIEWWKRQTTSNTASSAGTIDVGVLDGGPFTVPIEP